MGREDEVPIKHLGGFHNDNSFFLCTDGATRLTQCRFQMAQSTTFVIDHTDDFYKRNHFKITVLPDKHLHVSSKRATMWYDFLYPSP